MRAASANHRPRFPAPVRSAHRPRQNRHGPRAPPPGSTPPPKGQRPRRPARAAPAGGGETMGASARARPASPPSKPVRMNPPRQPRHRHLSSHPGISPKPCVRGKCFQDRQSPRARIAVEDTFTIGTLRNAQTGGGVRASNGAAAEGRRNRAYSSAARDPRRLKPCTRPGEDADRHIVHDPLPILPPMELRQIVRPHEPDEPHPGIKRHQSLKGFQPYSACRAAPPRR